MDIKSWFGTWPPFVKGLLGALVGGVLLFVALHAWVDHQALHQVVNWINARGWEAKAGTAPPALPKSVTPAP